MCFSLWAAGSVPVSQGFRQLPEHFAATLKGTAVGIMQMVGKQQGWETNWPRRLYVIILEAASGLLSHRHEPYTKFRYSTLLLHSRQAEDIMRKQQVFGIRILQPRSVMLGLSGTHAVLSHQETRRLPWSKAARVARCPLCMPLPGNLVCSLSGTLSPVLRALHLIVGSERTPFLAPLCCLPACRSGLTALAARCPDLSVPSLAPGLRGRVC